MRLLMTADTVGGVWTYAVELIRALAGHGVEAMLATMGAPLSAAQRSDIRVLTNLAGVFESSYKLEWMEDPWEDVRAAGHWLLGIAERVRPDLLHLNGYAHGALGWPAPVVMVGHSCVLSWWEAVHGVPAPERWRRYREEVARGLTATSVVAAPTCAMLGALQRHYGVRGGRVVPNARSPRIPSREKRDVVLSAGRLWDEAKNLRAIAAAAPRLPWPVCVAGEAQHPEGGRNVLDGVRALGPLSPGDLAEWYADAAIYALPAKYEPFGLSVLEAAQAGCALVLGDIPSLRENWDGAALFVHPSDEQEFEGVLRRVITDSSLRLGLQERARQRAKAFTPEAMARGYLDAYAEATAKETTCAS
ncbi:MAG TPA: glycosyltransferase family 4 protein [Bryobacteraceae bacterium]|nr:glycosyltransferase family 4 protein [Bryobacteraceae bacterium]